MTPTLHSRRTVADFLQPMDAVLNSPRLVRHSDLQFERNGVQLELPKFRFTGPPGGGDPLHIGIFATIHGDEPESGLGLIRFLKGLCEHPDQAQGFIIHAYPVCNPSGFENGCRVAPSGKDLNREFWRNSDEPEVRLLEKEILRNPLHGIVSLHCDDTSHGLYGFLSGRQTGDVFSANLLAPALLEAERFLPRNLDPHIDGFQAQSGILASCYDGVLRAPNNLGNPPFEITFETPQHAPASLQVEAFNAALLAILTEYRNLLAYAANL